MQLMHHLQERMDDFVCNGSTEEVLAWYTAQAKQRWRKVYLHSKTRSIVTYWIHTANKPGSAGHMSGMRFIQTYTDRTLQ